MVRVTSTNLVWDGIIMRLRVPGLPTARAIYCIHYSKVRFLAENLMIEVLTKWTVHQIRTCIINGEVPKGHDESTKACPPCRLQRTNPKRIRSNPSESGSDQVDRADPNKEFQFSVAILTAQWIPQNIRN
jgi:hypothetical protein